MKSLNYDLLEKQKNKMLKGISTKKGLIEELQNTIKKYESEYSEIDTSTFKKEIAELEKDIENTFNGKIKQLNEELTKGAEAFNRLYQARAGLREQFDEALKLLSEVKSNPDKYLGSGATDDQRKELLGYIDTIVGKINAEAGEHKVHEQGAHATYQKYEALLKKTS